MTLYRRPDRRTDWAKKKADQSDKRFCFLMVRMLKLDQLAHRDIWRALRK